MHDHDRSRLNESFSALRIAILIPCYNEAQTIGNVIADFRDSLPSGAIYVYDNNSTDGTAEIARRAGAIVRREMRQGKGFVVRRMFADIEADIYVLADGDATYEASAAPRLVAKMLSGPYDKINGLRVQRSAAAYRFGHRLGNKVLSAIVSNVFGKHSKDMLSGYKVLSHRFVKSFPATSSAFEIETELLVHALDLDVPMAEVETAYEERPAGSHSKLSTIKDGVRILWLIIHLIRDLRPLHFFASLAVLLAIVALALGVPVVIEFFRTGFVPRLPTAVLASALMMLSFLSIFSGLILDSVAKGRREAKLLAYLGHASLNVDDAVGHSQYDCS